MSTRSLEKVAFGAMSIALLAMCLQSVSLAENQYGFLGGPYEGPRMATFDNSLGETTFALSVSPKVDSAQRASDIVVFVDTSASQAGVFKKDSIATLEQLLSSLNADDRVKLVAIDLDPVELTKGFFRPDSKELTVAIENLKQRVSLGTTDMVGMLKSAPGHFESTTDRNKNVIYIGDGVTRGSLLKSVKYEVAVTSLVANKVSVSSYAIGPERDVKLLASLANLTGGNFYVDSDDEMAMKNGAIGLAQTVHGSVFWPTATNLPEQVSESFPKSVPLRTDRDSILVGTLKDRGQFEVSMDGEINGEMTSLTWQVDAEASNDDFAFLPQLVQDARANRGLSLPTAGSNGLREAGRVILANSRELGVLSRQAMATGNVNAAKKLATAALKRDPHNTEAYVLSEAASYAIRGTQDDDPFQDGEASDPFEGGQDAPAEEPVDVVEPVTEIPQDEPAPAEVPAADLTAPPQEPIDQSVPGQPEIVETDDSFQAIGDSFQREDVQNLLRQGQAAESQNLIQSEEDRINVLTEKLTAQTEYELTRAREELAGAPGQAIERIKSMIDILDQTTQVDPNRAQDLRNRLVSALMTARQRKLAFDDRMALRDQNIAAKFEYERAIREYEREEEELAQLINRFESLMEDFNYEEARDVTYQALTLNPFSPEAVAADGTGRVRYAYRLNYELGRTKRFNYLATLLASEKSAIPFPGDPPLVFPDAQEWARKKAARAKYQDVRLAGNDNDEAILRALEEPAFFDEEEVEFEEIMDRLTDQYGINIVLDSTARDDALAEDEPITFKVSGIRLKNALRLLLKDHNATFIVRDETLQIISLDVANDPEYFVTNVYNVGDLVAPRNNPGGIGGGGGGFGGGGGGFGGGGGGGFGGGGRGGGGGGGIFCIQDNLSSDVQKTEPVATEVSTRRNAPKFLKVERQPNQSWMAAWSDYFEKNHASPADVRYTVRRLGKQKDSEQIVGLIQGSLKNNQSAPWMYEAMVLSMQIAKHPKSEIERALMSTVDLSGSYEDSMLVADYMAKNGMEKRAVRLLQDLVVDSTIRPEPFMIALNAAQKVNDLEGIQWASLGILSQAWPKHRDVVKKAIYAAEAVRKQLAKENRKEELEAFNHQLDKALYRDCIVKVTWTGDADIDIYVEEPGGTVCSRQNPRTTAGGIMMGDDYASANQNGEMTEYYVLPKGFSGDYRLLIRKVWGEITAGKVSVSIYNHFRTDKEASQQKFLEVDEKGTLVLFELKDGRLQESLDEHSVKTVAEQQYAVNRQVLAQQLADGYSPSAASEYYASESESESSTAGNGQPVAPRVRRPGAVGYRPEITQLFEGTFLTINHATTSDRLYVMVSASPFFNQVTRVDTFNIFGSAQNAQGTGGGGIGGGGVGGLGGGGGGAGGGLGGGGGGGLF